MYLAKRGSTYYHRRPVPDELQPFILTNKGKPRTEFMESLRTKDLAEAKRRLGRAIVAAQKALDVAQAMLQARSAPATASSPMTPQDEYEEWAREASWQDTFEEDCRIEAREAAQDKLREFFRRPASELTDAQLALRDMFAQGELDDPQIRAARERQREKQYADAAAEVAAEWTAKLTGRSQPITARTISKAFEEYVGEKEPAASTVKRWRPIIAHLTCFLGHDDPTRVTEEDVVAWKDALKGEVLANGKTRGARTISEAYLPAARVTFEYARVNRWISTNPVADVSIFVPETILAREDRGFTDDEASIILKGSLSQDPLDPSLSARARRWIPWLCAYTGARVNEITSLLAEEVRMIEGVWVIHIKPSSQSERNTGQGGSQRTVKTRKARSVPLHPHLIEQGFIRLIQDVGSGPVFYDPGKSRSPNPANPQHKKVGERLGAWVRSLGVTDEQIGPSHAWRHLFTTIARTAGIEDAKVFAITGHSQKSEGAKYGRYTATTLFRELEKFPRFRT